MSQPCMCGATDCPRCHPDHEERDRIDAALDDVVETITQYSQYPRPIRGCTVRARFDLWDFVHEYYDRAEVTDIAVYVLTLNGAELSDYVMRKQRHLEEALRDHLRGSDIVRERAEELREEAMEDPA